MSKIDWENLFKVKIANYDDSFQKHEVIKLLIVMKILKKYRRRNLIRIYTEFNLNGVTPDVYFENIKERSIICYEIQKECPESYIKNKIEEYQKIEIPFFNPIDLIIIPLKNLSDNIVEINKQLDKYIF